MKTFSIDAAWEGAPLQWRNPSVDGWVPVSFIGMDDDLGQPVVKYASQYFTTSENNLRMKSVQRTVYVNLYEKHDAVWFADKERAERSAAKSAIVIAIAVPVEIEK